MFQFLIGNLITKRFVEVIPVDEKFQFLIGNLITIVWDNVMQKVFKSFNSL